MAPVKKLFTSGFALWFAASQLLLGAGGALAQGSATGFDVEPPLIEHEIIGSVDANFRQSFVATVVDDDELDTVSLFYRFDGEPTYSSILMKRVSFSSTYIAHIPTDPTSDATVEYYIQARDISGNRTVRGYAFNPLQRSIVLANAAIGDKAVANANDTPTVSVGGSKRTVLYIVLGVLAAGLVAGLAGGSGGGGIDPPGGTECSNSRCGITITVGQP